MPNEPYDPFGYHDSPDTFGEKSPYTLERIKQSLGTESTELNAAFYHLVRYYPDEFVKILGDVNDPNFPYALDFLYSYPTGKAIEWTQVFAPKWLASNDPVVLAQVVHVIDRFGGPKEMRLMIPLLASNEPEVKNEVKSLLGTWVDSRAFEWDKLTSEEQKLLSENIESEWIPKEKPFENWPSMPWRGITLYITDNMTRKCRGLIGVKEEQFKNQAILFPHIPAIHSRGCLFDFDAVYLDRDGTVLERRTVPPDQNFVNGPRGSTHVLELPRGVLPEIKPGEHLTEFAEFFGRNSFAYRVARYEKSRART